MSYQNPKFNKDRYWKLKGKKREKEQPKVLTPGVPLSIQGDDIVAENRMYRRLKVKTRKYSFYHRKGYYDEKGAIKIERPRLTYGKMKRHIKWVPVIIDKQ